MNREWVYKQLEDEESKSIFENRGLYYDTGDYTYIKNIVMQYVPEFSLDIYRPEEDMNFVKSLMACNKKIIIYGCGNRGKKLYDLLQSAGGVVECFCDSDIKKWGTLVGNVVEVKSFDEVLESGVLDDGIVAVSPMFCHKEIVKYLLEKGVAKESIFVFGDNSRKSCASQYFDSSILNLEEEEVFVDGGCYNFQSSMEFKKFCEKNGAILKKVYAFEADKYNFEVCNQNRDFMDDVTLLENGLWSKNATLHFKTEESGASYITSKCTEETYSINVVAMDSVIKERVTYIKLDIEGAELEALKGAQEIIKKYKPKLAICLYHKEEDMVEIPYYIKTLVPEYKLYIRHYSNNECETVLYAV